MSQQSTAKQTVDTRPSSNSTHPEETQATASTVHPLKPLDSDSDTSSEDYLNTLKKKKTQSVRVTVCKQSFQATIDNGATNNVIDDATVKKMDGVNLKKTSIKAFAYKAKEAVEFQGKFEATIETKRVAVATFCVAQTSDSSLLI